MEKKRAIRLSYSSRDCETWYRCPYCNKNFGDWTTFHQPKNENGTKDYCPNCKKELRM